MAPFDSNPPEPEQQRQSALKETVARSSRSWQLEDGNALTLRVARTGDGDLMQHLVRSLSVQSRYHRFFYPVHELAPDMLERFSQADPTRAITLLAVITDNDRELPVGMAQYVADPYPERGEFGVVVADAWQRKGIGRRLLRGLVFVARVAGVGRMEGDILSENGPMRQLLLSQNFSIGAHSDGAYLMKAWQELQPLPCEHQYSTATPSTPSRSTSVCFSASAGATRHSSASRISQPTPCCM